MPDVYNAVGTFDLAEVADVHMYFLTRARSIRLARPRCSIPNFAKVRFMVISHQTAHASKSLASQVHEN